MHPSPLHKELARACRQAILELLYAEYPRARGDGLLFAGIQKLPGLDCTMAALRRELNYLEGRQQVKVEKRPEMWIVSITPEGIDALEGGEDYPPSERDAARMLRLRVLMMLSLADDRALQERVIRRMLAEERDLDTSPPAIHRALAYLCDCGLAQWVGPEAARILPDGTDYLHYEGPDRAGVARPAHY